MANKLKIYACSGIGSTAETNDPVANLVPYWTDNTNCLNNTQAINTLLARINSRWIEVVRLRGLTDEERLHKQDEIDFLCVALDLVRTYTGNTEMLWRAGEVMEYMRDNGSFDFGSLNSAERDVNLDELIKKANELMSSYTIFGGFSDPDFEKWWKATVMDRDEAVAVAGIGISDDWKNNEDLSEMLNKGSEYFLYTYFTDEQIAKANTTRKALIKAKRNKQRATYQYCKKLFVGIYGSESEMQSVIRSGIVNYFGMTPETVCEELATGKRESVGDFGVTEVVVAVIGAVASIMIAVIPVIVNAAAKVKGDKYAAIDKQAVETSVPDEEDWSGLSLGGGKNGGGLLTSGMDWLPLAAVAAGAFMFMKK